jgi:hypothetical protein
MRGYHVVGDTLGRDKPIPSTVHRKSQSFWSCLVLGCDYQSGKYSLLVLLSLGLVGVLIDVDHVVREELQMARPFHLQVFVFVWVCVFVVYAYYSRRFHNIMLKENYE